MTTQTSQRNNIFIIFTCQSILMSQDVFVDFHIQMKSKCSEPVLQCLSSSSCQISNHSKCLKVEIFNVTTNMAPEAQQKFKNTNESTSNFIMLGQDIKARLDVTRRAGPVKMTGWCGWRRHRKLHRLLSTWPRCLLSLGRKTGRHHY